MAREIDPSDRLQLRSRGELLHPGSCAICGSSDPERTYVDTGIFYDYEGRIYICNICGTQIGEILGLFTPDEIELTNKQLDESLTKIVVLEKELEDARPIMDSITSMFGNLSSSNSEPSVPADSEPEGSSETSDEVTSDAVSGEPEVTEPVSKPGRTDTSGSKRGNGSKPTRKIFTE